MALLTPLWMQPDVGSASIEYPLGEDRLGFIGSLFSRTGVLDLLGGHLRVTQRAAGANMTVDVAIGRGVIAAGDGGMYLCNNTSVVNLSTPAGDRAYRIIARVRDKQAFAEAASDWTLEAIFLAGSTPPATPARAISLATFNTLSTTTSVTTAGTASSTVAVIADTRSRATVGTMGLTGDWGQQGIHPVWQSWDSTRPPRYMKNSDGWVFLSGWIRRQNTVGFVNGGTFWDLDDTSGFGSTGPAQLPEEIRPSGNRDVAVMTSVGSAHFLIRSNGHMNYRFFSDKSFPLGAWMSFDGVFYKQFAS